MKSRNSGGVATRRSPPRNMRAKTTSSGKTYYYYDCGYNERGVRKWIALGSNFIEAVRKWAELESTEPTHVVTFRNACEEYFKSAEFKEKSARTQADYLSYVEQLYTYFDDPPAPLDHIETHHIQKYHVKRSKVASVRANREIAFLSIVWNFARRMGYTNAPNPKKGVRRNKEKGRGVYVYDEEFLRVLAGADECVRDTLELAYLLGQRPADVFKLSINDVRDNTLDVRQNKTDEAVNVELSAALTVVVTRCLDRRARTAAKGPSLLVNERGAAFTYSAFVGRFDTLRADLGIDKADFQLRDMRSKAATDIRDKTGLDHAQKLLGHKDIKTTQHYTKRRRGVTTAPTK